MLTTGIIGAGNVGANAAFFLAERNVGPVVVRDVEEGRATGKMLDIMEAAPLGRYHFPVRGTDSEQEVLDSDVLLVAAGATRVAGASRESLLAENRPLISGLAGQLKGFGGVVVVATEPVDAMVTLLVREAGLDSKRVMGLGGCLDVARMRFCISRELGCAVEDVDAMAVGRHDSDIIIPLSYSKVSGIPVEHLLSAETCRGLVEEVRGAGERIVEQSGRSAAFYAPAAVAADVIEAVVRDSGRVLSVSSVLDGQLDARGVALSLPAMIGAEGIRRILEPKLAGAERKAFAQSASAVAELVG